MPFLSIFHKIVVCHRAREEETCYFCLMLMPTVAFPDGTGIRKRLWWTQLFTQCSNRKKLAPDRPSTFLNPLQTSPTPPLPRKHSASMLRTVQPHTVVQPACYQYSVLCFVRHCVRWLVHLHIANGQYACALVSLHYVQLHDGQCSPVLLGQGTLNTGCAHTG